MAKVLPNAMFSRFCAISTLNMAEPACMSQMVYLGPRQHTVGSSEELAGVIYQFVEITQASKLRRKMS